MKNILLILSTTLLLACYSYEIYDDCKEVNENRAIGLLNNPYKDINEIVFINIVSGNKLVYSKVDTVIEYNQKKMYDNSYSGNPCYTTYNFHTSYLIYKTIDLSTIQIANTNTDFDQNNKFDYDRYIFKIDSSYILLPGKNEEGYRWNKTEIDSIFINNKLERFVLKNTIYHHVNANPDYVPMGEIYFNTNNKILRFVNFSTNDTFDVQ